MKDDRVYLEHIRDALDDIATYTSAGRATWRVRLFEHFNHRQYHALPALYVYDFGDDWEVRCGRTVRTTDRNTTR